MASRSSIARWMNRIAVIVFAFSLLAFVAFHLLVEEYYVYPLASGASELRGWENWVHIWEYRKSPYFGEMSDLVIILSLLCFAGLSLVSPFLVPVLRMSRPLWWVGVLLSGMVLLNLGGFMLMNPSDPEISVTGPGTYCLMAALVLNFLGFLFIRREPLLDPRPSPEEHDT